MLFKILLLELYVFAVEHSVLFEVLAIPAEAVLEKLLAELRAGEDIVSILISSDFLQMQRLLSSITVREALVWASKKP